MGDIATGKVLADVVRGTSQANKAVITDGDNKIDSLDMTVVKAAGVDVSSDLVKLTAITATAVELNKLDGGAVTNAELNELVGITETPLQTAEVFFTQTAANAVHTGSVTLPPGSTLIDIIVHAAAVWDSGTSAVMKVGDTNDDDGYFTAVNVKATDLTGAQSISFGYTGGKEGAYLDGGEAAGDHVRRRYLAGNRVISGIITDVNVAGTAGRTRMTVVFSLPTTPVAATVV